MRDNDEADKYAEASGESGDLITPARAEKSQPEDSRRAALLVKGVMLAAVTLTHTPRHNVVASRDPRCAAPSVRPFADPKRARSAFLRTVRAARARGWRVFYDGPPLNG